MPVTGLSAAVGVQTGVRTGVRTHTDAVVAVPCVCTAHPTLEALLVLYNGVRIGGNMEQSSFNGGLTGLSQQCTPVLNTPRNDWSLFIQHTAPCT